MSKERPILMSAPMVKAILAGRKSQTRRACKSYLQTVYTDHPDWRLKADEAATHCPYGVPGDRLCYSNPGERIWYNHSGERDHYERNEDKERGVAAANPSSAERRLYGRRGRSDLLPDKAQRLRAEGVDGLVSASGAYERQGIQEHFTEPQQYQDNQERASAGLHGISRDAVQPDTTSAPLGRKSGSQSTCKSGMGNSGGQLAGSAGTWDCERGRETLGSETDRRRTGASSLGRSQRAMQSTARGKDAGTVAGYDSRHRVQGDRLWVKETWAVASEYDDLSPSHLPVQARERIWYLADGPKPQWAGRSRPSIFMPRAVSRITLEITEVRVERVQDISEEDAIAEGIEPLFDAETIRATVGLEPYRLGEPVPWTNYLWHGRGGAEGYSSATCARDSYRTLWDSINGKGAWDRNDWVWVVCFQRVQP